MDRGLLLPAGGLLSGVIAAATGEGFSRGAGDFVRGAQTGFDLQAARAEEMRKQQMLQMQQQEQARLKEQQANAEKDAAFSRLIQTRQAMMQMGLSTSDQAKLFAQEMPKFFPGLSGEYWPKILAGKEGEPNPLFDALAAEHDHPGSTTAATLYSLQDYANENHPLNPLYRKLVDSYLASGGPNKPVGTKEGVRAIFEAIPGAPKLTDAQAEAYSQMSPNQIRDAATSTADLASRAANAEGPGKPTSTEKDVAALESRLFQQGPARGRSEAIPKIRQAIAAANSDEKAKDPATWAASLYGNLLSDWQANEQAKGLPVEWIDPIRSHAMTFLYKNPDLFPELTSAQRQAIAQWRFGNQPPDQVIGSTAADVAKMLKGSIDASLSAKADSLLGGG